MSDGVYQPSRWYSFSGWSSKTPSNPLILPLDFCLFAPPTPDSTIGDTEGVEVAWCTKKGHGTRLIPEGTLKGVQLIQSPGYIEIVGFIDQTKLNLQDGDYGGELDSGGQDGVSISRTT